MRRFVLERLYPTALSGLPVLGTPQELATSVRGGNDTLTDKAEQLVRRHVAISGAAGFASGLGGWLTLPVVLPANLAGVAVIQLHMSASVAALAGKDLSDESVRDQVVSCLIGVAPVDPERDAEQETMDRFGLKLAERGLNFVISNTARLASWAGRKVVKGQVKKRLIRGVPFVGGVIGAVSDGYVTSQIARCAIDTFIDEGGRPTSTPFPPASGDGASLPTPAEPTTAPADSPS